jgi:hypothetical protein
MNDRKNNKHIHLKKLDHSLPSDYIDIVERCLSFERNERPGDVQTIRRRLEALHTKCTSLTPESTVLLYVNQRKQNEPFTLPKPLHPVRTVVIFTTVGIITASAVFIISNNKFRAQYLSTFIPQVSATVTKPDIIPENLVITPKINLLTDETDDFYAPETDTTQASLMHALRREWTARRYDQMLKVIEQMPAELAASKEVILYRFRSLGRGGEELGVLLKEVNISDGEFYFHKARYLFGNKDYVTALENLIRAESLPSEFLDKRILGREVQLYKARSLTALFRSDPTSENLTIAMQSWNKLLQLVKDYPGSLHNKEAEREKENLVAEATWRGISIAESN